MVALIDKILQFLRSKILTSVGIVVFAALMVELISIMQYRRLYAMEQDRMQKMTAGELRSRDNIITNTLLDTEDTMQEHLWDVQQNLTEPDSLFAVTARLISANRDIIGGCLAFVPDHFPQKGRYFEPYAHKKDGDILIEQLGSDEHDYTQNPIFQQVLRDGKPIWSDPYLYGSEPVRSLTTYSYPIKDREGDIVAVCGLDIDVSWLLDTLNTKPTFPSSFTILFTQNGEPVAGPTRQQRGDPRDVEQVVRLMNDSTVVWTEIERRNCQFTEFRNHRGDWATLCQTDMQINPYWQVAQVTYHDEVYGPMRKLRRRQVLLVLLGLLILFFMIDRFVRNEQKLSLVTAEKARIGSELAIARRIQRQMLPKDFPLDKKRKDLDIYGHLDPAREVGGDLYDAFIRDDKLVFCIGDVSGKGVPSAMVMSVMHSLFRMISAHDDDPANIVRIVNEELCRDNDSNMFVTFFLGILDLPTGKVHYCNAGHDHPFVVTDSAMELPVIANLPLGVFSDTVFEGQEFFLPAGSTFFLYTDGLTEAKDLRRNQFTKQRVKERLERSLQLGETAAESMVKGMCDEVSRFVGEAEQSDDLTILAIRYLPDDLEESIKLRCDMQELPRLTDFVKTFSARLDIGKAVASGLRLALEETVVNVISYAYPDGEKGDVTVKARIRDRDLQFTVTDSGIPFDPTAVPEADTTLDAEARSIGGLGIHMARKMMDSVQYERIDNLNILTLNKHLS